MQETLNIHRDYYNRYSLSRPRQPLLFTHFIIHVVPLQDEEKTYFLMHYDQICTY